MGAGGWNRLSDNVIDQAVMLRRAGGTYRSIAHALNVSKSALQEHLVQRGFTGRDGEVPPDSPRTTLGMEGRSTGVAGRSAGGATAMCDPLGAVCEILWGALSRRHGVSPAEINAMTRLIIELRRLAEVARPQCAAPSSASPGTASPNHDLGARSEDQVVIDTATRSADPSASQLTAAAEDAAEDERTDGPVAPSAQSATAER